MPKNRSRTNQNYFSCKNKFLHFHSQMYWLKSWCNKIYLKCTRCPKFESNSQQLQNEFSSCLQNLNWVCCALLTHLGGVLRGVKVIKACKNSPQLPILETYHTEQLGRLLRTAP